MYIRPYPTQAELRSLYNYDDETEYVISDVVCVGGLERKDKSRTRRTHHFIGVKNSKDGYIAAYVRGHKGLFNLNRLVWIYHYGDVPEGRQVDHKNHVRSYNRISNLRLATWSQNQMNRKGKRAGAAPGKVGAVKQGDKWAAFVRGSGGPKYLGRFDTEQAAADARQEACIVIDPEFYRSNVL